VPAKSSAQPIVCPIGLGYVGLLLATEHTINRVTKVVSGMDEGTTELVAELYSKITLT
jgi:UDP-N-acetyl-D-mannosaminuronate dehydrogenase